MSRLHLDRKVCQAYGNCVMEAPDYFNLDDADDLGVVLKETVEPADEERVVAAARSCPVQAIQLIEAAD